MRRQAPPHLLRQKSAPESTATRATSAAPPAFDPNQFQRLREIAKRVDRKPCDLIRRAIDQYIEREKKSK